MPEALKDAEEAIKIDPSFIKAYIRKALTQQTMKEMNGALETLQKATEMDVEKKVCLEGTSCSLWSLMSGLSAYPRAGVKYGQGARGHADTEVG